MMRCFDKLGKLNAAIHIQLSNSRGGISWATLIFSHNGNMIEHVDSSKNYIKYFKAFHPNLNWDTVVICK